MVISKTNKSLIHVIQSKKSQNWKMYMGQFKGFLA